METINQTYTTLRELGLTRSQYDFSQRWLGQGRSYFSAAKARNREPSLCSMLFLDHQLETMLKAMATVNGSRYAQVGARQLRKVQEAVWLRLQQRALL